MRYGCYNRPPLADGQTLHGMDSHTGEPIVVTIPHRMTTACQYQADDPYSDPGCNGCKHKVAHE